RSQAATRLRPVTHTMAEACAAASVSPLAPLTRDPAWQQHARYDTSIPVSYFAPDKWRLRPFGRYTGPIAVFARNYQPKLTQLVQKGRAESLDFGLGYQWRVSSSNLLLATRSEPQAINPPDAGSDSELIASKGPDVPPDSAEQAATTPAAGAEKTTSKNGTKKQRLRTAARRPAPFYFPFFFGR